MGESDATAAPDGQPKRLPMVSISTPGPAGSPAVAATCEDLAALGVRELIGLLADLEDASRGRHSAAWAARWTTDEVDADWVLSRQRQVIGELRRRRSNAATVVVAGVRR